jgi:hypothetical protein
MLLGTAAAAGLPGTAVETFSGSFTTAGVDLNGDGVPTATHGSGTGQGNLGKFTFDTISELNAVPVGIDTANCPGLQIELQYDVFSEINNYKGDLLFVRLDPGDMAYVCVSLESGEFTGVFDLSVVGGTGRFHGAAGRSFAEVTGGTVVLDASGNTVFGASTGSAMTEFE